MDGGWRIHISMHKVYGGHGIVQYIMAVRSALVQGFPRGLYFLLGLSKEENHYGMVRIILINIHLWGGGGGWKYRVI